MTRKLARLRDWFLLLACNFIWATQFVLVKIVQVQMGPVAATAFPIALAAVLLGTIVRFERRDKGSDSGIARSSILQFFYIGFFGQVVAQLLITWGLRYTPASNAALLMLTLPISTAIMAFFFLGEKMTPVRWFSFALAIGGVIECSGIDWKELSVGSPKVFLGNVLIFASVNGSAFYNTYSKKLLTRYTPLQVLLYSYLFALVFLLPVTAAVEPSAFPNLPHFRAAVWVGLLILAIFQYGLSMVIFLTVLTRLDATQASLSNYLIPVFGVIVAAIVLHERLTSFMIVGGVFVLASTLLVTVYEERQTRARARSEQTLV